MTRPRQITGLNYSQRSRGRIGLTVPPWLTTIDPLALGGIDFVNNQSYGMGYDFTRASVGEHDNVAGVWAEFLTNILRRSDRGARIEASRANRVNNNSMIGSVNGSPGTLATGWTNGTTTGFTREVIGTGVENGLPYLDFRFFTAAAGFAGPLIVYPGPHTDAPAGLGETWTTSWFAKIIDAPIPPVSYRLRLYEYDASAILVNSEVTFTGSMDGTLRRFELSRTTSNAAVANVRGAFVMGITNGAAHDFTLRVAAPQLELNSSASAPILTTSAAVTRAADDLDLKLFAGTKLRFTFDDNSTQEITTIAAPYQVPTNLNRRVIKNVVALAA